MVDFNINLAKSMTSAPEERRRFYNRMLIYLVVCAAALVGVAYLSSLNIMNGLRANRQSQELISAVTAVSSYGKSFYKNPAQAYKEFKAYASDLESLRGALAKRPQFLPVMSQLFNDFPKNVAMQSLSATAADNTLEFVLVAPVIDENGQDVLKKLQTKWKDNAELQARVNAVRQVTNERNMVGDTLMAYVKYKCILK